MKKATFILTLAFLVGSSSQVFAQENTKYIDKNGSITFEASEELFEPVKATNKSVTAILNTATNEIAALALVKEFRFKNSLMEEHFNENYIESETYPKAIFKGKLFDFDISEVTENSTKVIVNGTLELHGTEKEIMTTLNINKVGDSVILQGSFTVTPSDFNITIPNIVKNKIAKEIVVSINFDLSQK